MVLLIQFIVRVLDISVVVQRQVRTVPTYAKDSEDFTGVVLVRGWSRQSLRNDRCWDGPDSTENRDGAAVAVCHRARRHSCCGVEANPGFGVHCCEHAATSSSSLG